MKRRFFSSCLFMLLSIMINAQGIVSGSQVDKAKTQAIIFTIVAAVIIVGIVLSIIRRRQNNNRYE